MINGLVFGKFAPLTKGHISFIKKAAGQCDHLYLFLSFDQKFVDQQPEWIQDKLCLEYRLCDLKDQFFRYPNITVSYVDESDIPGYPEGSEAYEKLIRAALPQDVQLHRAFSSEPEYDTYFAKHFPECEHVVIDADRQSVPISATMVRENVFKHFGMLSDYAKRHFIKKVAIVGVESTGKTTLTQNLAKHFGAEYVPEVGRIICENQYHASEMLMTRDDYFDVALYHRIHERKLMAESDVGVMFSDTTNLITYFSGVCSGKIEHGDSTFHALSKEEGENFYDLVLYLTPEVPWVSEPLRLQDTPEKREETNRLLEVLVNYYYSGTQVVAITGTDYDDRTAQAILAVENLLNGKQ